MKGKVMTWDEFRAMCKEDAYNWSYAGWTVDDLEPDDIISCYDDDFFSDDEYTEYDELSNFFTPEKIARQTIDYLDDIEYAE